MQIKKRLKYFNTVTFGWTTSLRIQKVKSYTLFPFQVLLLAILISFSYSYLFETPEEHALKVENAQHLQNLSLVQAELDELNSKLTDIQDKDDNLYRLVLGVDKVPTEIRAAGIGGTEINSNKTTPKELNLNNYYKEVNQLNARLNVQSASFEELTLLASENINRLQHRPSIFPIAPSDLVRFASGYGYRTHPIFNIRKFHKGIDLSALKGSPIHATAKGKVIIASNLHDGYGNKIVIDHGFGYKTVYAHLHKIQTKVGQEIELGDLIGQVGNTGISVSPHLHYEVRLDDRVMNPLDYVFKDISAEEYDLITKR